MRRRFVLRGGRLVELDLETPPVPSRAPYVRGDIAPYRSMRTGETIGGRAQHREHLARYDLIEIGNERRAFFDPPPAAPPGKGEIARDIKRELARDPGERRSIAESALRGAGYAGPQIERILKS
jgi:hypothetical protein